MNFFSKENNKLMEQVKGQISKDFFDKIDVRVGTIINAKVNKKAREPAFELKIDFGEIGTKTSSAKITDYYTPEKLIGTQVIAVVNLPPFRVGIKSEVLVLGAVEESGKVVLLRPDQETDNGLKIG